MRKMPYKVGMIFVVMNLVGIAVALFLAVKFGSDSIGLLCDGLSRVLHISFGNASLLYNLLIIILAYFVARNNLGGGTIVYALCSGYFIDFYRMVLSSFNLGEQSVFVRIFCFALGQCFLSSGLAILIQLELGMNALDAIICKIQEKTSISYRMMRTGCDISYVVIGTLCGGTFGVGTICSVLLTGTMVSKIMILIDKVDACIKRRMI